METKTTEQINSIDKLDVVYESPRLGFLSALDRTSDQVKKEHTRLKNTLKKFGIDENYLNILALESSNKLFVFRRIYAIFSIEILAKQHVRIMLILPAGEVREVIPTNSNEEGDNYLSTYKIESAVIGIAVPKSAEIKEIIATPLLDKINNISSLVKKEESTKARINLFNAEDARVQREIELNQVRVSTLKKESDQLEITLNYLQKQINEKESQVSSIDLQVSKVVKERGTQDKILQEVKAEVDRVAKQKQSLDETIVLRETTISSLDGSVSKLKQEVLELSQKKSLFDNELSGFNVEGKRQSNIYIMISYVVLVLLALSVYITFERGFEFLNYPKDQKMLDILISRIPLTVGISLVISMCFGFAYFMINQAIKINADRMKFIKASIIAKDMWIAAEAVEDLKPFEREKLRQQTKLELISKVFHDESRHKEQDSKLLDLLIEKLSANKK